MTTKATLLWLVQSLVYSRLGLSLCALVTVSAKFQASLFNADLISTGTAYHIRAQLNTVNSDIVDDSLCMSCKPSFS